MTEPRLTWRFPKVFWVANCTELCERAAYYGTFIALRTFLIRVVHLDDVEAGLMAAYFGAFIYFAAFFTGALADRMGFRRALILAFALLTAGYGSLGLFHEVLPVFGGITLIVIGGAFVKPVITGTASKASDGANRARAFSIFYMVVNIGSFTGKTVVPGIRINLGVENVPFFSAAAAGLALLVTLLFYRPKEDRSVQPRDIKETLRGMWMAMSNLRFLALILITAGFWAIQGQLYGSMPDYVLRMAGESFKPEWYANVNPLVVMLCVMWITQIVRTWKPEVSILVAMSLIPLSSLSMAASHLFSGPLHLFGVAVHPITAMMVLGIAVQGVAECFLSPKYLEFASKQAPRGKEGVFLGFSHMNTFFAWLFGMVFGGYLLKWFCPEPTTLPEAVRVQHTLALEGKASMPEAYAHAHYLWYAFAGVGILSLCAMVVFIFVTRHIDARRASTARP